MSARGRAELGGEYCNETQEFQGIWWDFLHPVTWHPEVSVTRQEGLVIRCPVVPESAPDAVKGREPSWLCGNPYARQRVPPGFWQ